MEDRITQLKAEIIKQEKLFHIAINSSNNYDTYTEYEIAIAPFKQNFVLLTENLE